MAGFALLGAADRIFGNRWGLGKEFEEGILAMGSLALAMLGIIALAPVLANLLRPVVVPVYGFLGADPAMFAGTLLLALTYGGRQWWTFAAIPLLMLYNGQRGKWKIGKLFYFYYPAHLVIIYILSLIL